MNADLVRCVGNAHRRGDRKDEISHWPASVMFHAPHGAKRMLVNIDGGNVQGVGSVDNPRAVFFLGIPCAAPPVGELRRKPPQRLALECNSQDGRTKSGLSAIRFYVRAIQRTVSTIGGNPSQVKLSARLAKTVCT